MKITIDVSQMAYEGTGVGRYTYELVKALLVLPTKHEFILWAGVRKQRFYFESLQKTEPWNRATWVYSHVSPKLAGVLFNYSPLHLEYLIGQTDLIHLSDWTAPVTRVPTVTTVHDLAFIKYPETVDPLIRRTQSIRLSRVVAHSNHIIADSLSTKNDLIEKYHVKDIQIDVVYPGISPVYSPASNKELERVKKKYSLPDTFILSLGTQEPRKNLDRLIEATKYLDLPLIIAGKYGWGKKLDSPAHVKVLGFVAEYDLPALYSSATVFCYPSLYEGFGFPVLEAMACATPVVTSNISSLPEVTGDAAILIDPTNIESIKSGIEQSLTIREKMIKKGIQQAKKFSWERSATQVMQIYEKLGSHA
ncbi:MAG: glycosyltransferase family 1 protein [Candidatus Microgenomates bacterium]